MSLSQLINSWLAITLVYVAWAGIGSQVALDHVIIHGKTASRVYIAACVAIALFFFLTTRFQ